MRKKRKAAIILMSVGGLLGGTWKGAEYTLGDKLFMLLKLPIWSKGTMGLHYSGLIGYILTLSGIALIITTMDEKNRKYVWIVIFLILITNNYIGW